MDGHDASSHDQLQDFVVSVVLFLVFAIALTVLCSTLLWCHFYVLFRKEKIKDPSLEKESYCSA